MEIMIGRVLFLSAVAYASYLYVLRSNRKAKRELERQGRGTAEFLPAEPPGETGSLRLPGAGSAAELLPTKRSVEYRSHAAEPM
jgi:hypothetical protein